MIICFSLFIKLDLVGTGTMTLALSFHSASLYIELTVFTKIYILQKQQRFNRYCLGVYLVLCRIVFNTVQKTAQSTHSLSFSTKHSCKSEMLQLQSLLCHCIAVIS